MGDGVKKVLFVNSEMLPYTPESGLAAIGRKLPQGIQEKKREIRTFMPRFGCINERKNQLHEVIRLSGMNLIICDVDRPLVIKVASIPAGHIQIYFIDNEDYFKRKQIYRAESGEFFEDNDERAVFYARGVLETVKRLRWEPDIIHCQGWFSYLLPLFLKKAYKDDPIFSNSKVVLSLSGDIPQESFSDGFRQKISFGGIMPEDTSLIENPNGTNLAKLAASYSDAVIVADGNVDKSLVDFCERLGAPLLPFNAESYLNGSYIEEYNSFYDKI